MTELETTLNSGPVYFLKSDLTYCPFCGTKLKIAYHNRTKKVFTLYGLIKAKNIVQNCPNDQCYEKDSSKRRLFSAEQFQILALPKCEIGLDITLYIGYHMHLRHQSLDEVFLSLRRLKIPIDRSSVFRHYQKYLDFMQELSSQEITMLKEKFKINKGYILAIDAVQSTDSPLLLVCRDTISNLVLGTKLIESESERDILPLLNFIHQNFSDPVAIVSDMGHGIKKSIEKVFSSTKHQYCHFHFLKNLGKDLLDTDYSKLKQIIHENKKN